MGFRAVSFEVVPVAPTPCKAIPRQCVIPGPRSLRFMTEDRFDWSALNNILHFCKRHQGIYVRTGVWGARESNPRVTEFMVDGRKEFVGVNGTLDCIPASIVNVVNCLLGHSGEIKARETLTGSGLRPTSVGRAVALVQSLRMRLSLRKSADASRIGSDASNSAFDIVAKFSTGVWLVRLLQRLTILSTTASS